MPWIRADPRRRAERDRQLFCWLPKVGRQLKQEKVRKGSRSCLSLCIRNEALPEPLAGETRHFVKRTWLFEEVRRAWDDHESLFTSQ